jgi:AraC family transcriptional regulator of adaptative response / DNA-3-methyladenine glycosylase II
MVATPHPSETSLHGVVRLPDADVCERARRSRDPRFDGLFFTAVASTGIYCRPVCPAPYAKRVRYFASAAAAEAAGFRPCLRCRPELSPAAGSWHRGDAILGRALKLIDAGTLGSESLGALARRLGIGERQLRRLFVERLGAAPIAVQTTRRLLFAKQLLTETNLPVTEVALASGFASLRRFNDAFVKAYRLAPRQLRRQRVDIPADGLVLRLAYRPPYDLAAMLDFLSARALRGVEVVADGQYQRVIGADSRGGAAWLRVGPWPKHEHALRLELHGVGADRLLGVVHRVRRMFDLDADPKAIADAFADDPRLGPLVRQRPGLRLPSGYDGFEIAVRAIVGQQVSVAAARTVASRLVEHLGTPLAGSAVDGLTHAFPSPQALLDADLPAFGLTRSRAATICNVARALIEGHLDVHGEQSLEDFVARWIAVPGIGPWTAQYIAMRALGHPDAFPVEDLGLRRAAGCDGELIAVPELRRLAENWRPWRAYAAIHLWHTLPVSTDRPRTSR